MRVVFCLPGKSFSGKFLQCWTDLLYYCLRSGIQPILSQKYSCNLYYVRQMCLGADVLRGKNQKPFNGEVDYDYLMWIDSDQIYTPKDFQRLLDADKDVVSGLYAFEGGDGYTCGFLDEDYFGKHGIMEYLTPGSIKDVEPTAEGLIEVDYAGFGFLLVKKGVYEKIEYPWHSPHWFKFGDVQDISMEDVGFCIKAGAAGFKIYVDPLVKIGHLKETVY